MQEELFQAFSPVSKAQWIESTRSSLSAEAWEKLFTQTPSGLEIEPFYQGQDSSSGLQQRGTSSRFFPVNKGGTLEKKSWYILQELIPSTSEGLGSQLKQGIRDGIKTFFIEVAAQELEELYRALTPDVLTQMDGIYMRTAESAEQIMESLVTIWEAASVQASFLGGLFSGVTSSRATLGPNISQYALRFPQFRQAGIRLDHATLQQNPIEQLAVSLAAFVETMVKISAHSTRETAFQQLIFLFPVGGDFFLEIAKFRAFRWVLSRCSEILGLALSTLPPPVVIGKTYTQLPTGLHTYENLYRSTPAAMAAILAGCEGLVVSTIHAETSDQSASEAARLARNIQYLLKHESHLDRVIDPAGGAYFVENLTHQLAQLAWQRFQEIEQEGGYSSYILTHLSKND